MKTLLIGLAAFALLVGIAVGVATPNKASAATMRRCVTRIHWTHLSGNKGSITDWITCGGGSYKFRARAECFPDGGNGKPEWRSGGWKLGNNIKSTAGCTSGYWLGNGGYNVWWNVRKYYVLWRYPGSPV